MTNASSALPHINLELDAYKHPHFDEWCYGEDRGPWQGGYPVVAQPRFEDAGRVFQAAVDIKYLRLERDQLPEFIAWLTAVYHATSEETGS
jgi:hypothetical protein